MSAYFLVDPFTMLYAFFSKYIVIYRELGNTAFHKVNLTIEDY